MSIIKYDLIDPEDPHVVIGNLLLEEHYGLPLWNGIKTGSSYVIKPIKNRDETIHVLAIKPLTITDVIIAKEN